jgi:hypothetical protein
MVRISSDTYEYVREIETELFPEPDPFANFDATDAYNSGTYTEPAYQAPSYSPQQYGQRIDDGLGHYSDDGGATWMNYSGGAYQEPAPAFDMGSDPYFGNFDAGAAENLGADYNPQQDYEFGNFDAGAAENLGSYDLPQSPTRAEFVDYDLGNMNSQFADPGFEAPWNPPWMREENAAQDLFSNMNIRQPDPYEPGYVEDSRFDTSGNMLGSPLNAFNDWFADPIAETGAQFTPFLNAAAAPGGFAVGELASRFGLGTAPSKSMGAGLSEFGSAVRDSGGNPFEFAAIQDENFNERPWYQQLGASALYDPTNLIGAGATNDVIKYGPDAVRGIAKYGDEAIQGIDSTLGRIAYRGADEVSPGVFRYPGLDEDLTAEAGMVFRKGQVPGQAERSVIPDGRKGHTPFALGELSQDASGMGVYGIIDADTGTVLRQTIQQVDNGWLATTGRVMDSPQQALIESTGAATKDPMPLANERLWFHSTRDMAYDLPDPDLAVGTQTGITQGPGIYMAADPAKSAGNYGPRTFVAEFDGKVLDLTKPVSPDAPIFEGGPAWADVGASLAKKLDDFYKAKGADLRLSSYSYGPLQSLETGSVFEPWMVQPSLGRSQLGAVDNAYGFRDSLVNTVARVIDSQTRLVKQQELKPLAGRFAGVESADRGVLAQAIVQNHLADNGVDALFHHSPNADGDVLIVLNGEAARAVADVKNAPDAVKAGATLKDIKRGAIGTVLTSAKKNLSAGKIWRETGQEYGDGAISLSWGPETITIAPSSTGKGFTAYGSDWTKEYSDKGWALADARVKMRTYIALHDKGPSTSLRSFGGGEAGDAGLEFAARLGGQTALGAGVGAAYGEASGGDWKTGAMVGAGIGAGTAVGFKGADALAGKGVDAKLAKTAPPPTATSKIIDLIKQAVPVRESQQDLYSKELARRAGIGQSIRSRVPGEAAGRAASGAMKGELPKATFDPIRPQMQPDEITELFEHLRTSNMPFYTWQNTQAALAKTLAGELPTRSEISLLGKAFGDDFAQALLSKRSLKDKAWEAALDAANIPRTLMTAWDASAPLRQGAILTAGHPIEGVKATAAMVRAMASPKYSKLVAEGIENSPNAAVYDKMKLYFADVTQGATLNQREEAIMSRLAGKIPGIAGSQRGYATYLNKIRQGIADNFIQGNPNLSTKEYEQFGHWINIASGRGDLPKLLADNSAIMNAMFAPRYAMSRLQLPGEIVKTMLDPRIGRHARAEMARDITAFAGTGAALLTLGQMAGVWKVELDPRSTDFGKGRIGPTRFDFWAGEQQIARYATQLATGQRKRSDGEIVSRGRMDVIQTWLETKMSPTTGLAIDLLRGEDFVGDPVDFKSKGGVGKQAWEMLTPLFLQDMAEAAKVNGSQWHALKAAPAALGASTMTYEDSVYAKLDKVAGGRFFDQSDEKQAEILAANPRLAKELEKERAETLARAEGQRDITAERPIAFERLKQIDEERLAKEKAAADAYTKRISPTSTTTFRKRLDDIQFEAATRRSELDENFKLFKQGELPTDPNKLALYQYYDVYDRNRIAGVDLDFDQVERELADLEKTWTQAQKDYVKAESSDTVHDPVAQRIYDAKATVRDIGYWDINDKVFTAWAAQTGAPVEPGQSSDEFFNAIEQRLFEKVRPTVKSDYEAAERVDTLMETVTKDYDDLVSKARKAAREGDPTLMRALVVAGYYDPGKELGEKLIETGVLE